MKNQKNRELLQKPQDIIIPETSVQNVEVSISKDILSFSLNLHSYFDENIWKQKSFHNERHISAVTESAVKLVVAALNNNDPLNILGDLEQWNIQHPENTVQPEELEEVVRITFALHDLGNIISSVSYVDDQINVDFLPQYSGVNSEDRTQEIIPVLLEKFKVDKKFNLIILHFISQTTFIYQESLFGLFARVSDQIGRNSSFDDLLGLVLEWNAENPDQEIIPDLFFNFQVRRLEQLVPDDFQRIKVTNIFNFPPHVEIENLSTQGVPVKEWLDSNLALYK